MALKGSFLSWSDDPQGFEALMGTHAERFSSGVFITEGDEIPKSVATRLGAKVYVVEVNLTDIMTYP